MKMAKATERDIDAAGNAMGVLQAIASGYYPAREGEDAPHTFDESDPAHLLRFFREMKGTLNASPGWPGRVIGGMCYVIMYDANQIIDPDADTLEIHPRFAAAAATPSPEGEAALLQLHEAADALDASAEAHDHLGNNSTADGCRARAHELRQMASRSLLGGGDGVKGGGNE